MKKIYPKIKRNSLLLALGAAMIAPSVQAANWLMLQGTEKEHQAPRGRYHLF